MQLPQPRCQPRVGPRTTHTSHHLHLVPPTTTATCIRDLQLQHRPTTPATMAKIPRSPPRSRKRPQHTDITATPPRRSRRITYKKPFRFNDLPPELRNTIYSNLLRRDEGSREIGLVDVSQQQPKHSAKSHAQYVPSL